MNRSYPILCLALLLLTCGRESPEPSLVLRIEGDPLFVTGQATIIVEPTPSGAYRGIEVSLGGLRLGNLSEPPFTLSFDSADFPDGETELVAIGVLAESMDTIESRRAVELANHPPVLIVTSPTDGEILLGSPSRGFVLAPVVTASDGNGIASLVLIVDGVERELDQADEIRLPVGTSFPHDPVTLTFMALDGSGAEASVEVSVIPSNLQFRTEMSQGYDWPGIEQLLLLADGRPLVRDSAGHLFLVASPELDVEPYMSLMTVQVRDDVLQVDDGFFFTAQGMEGWEYRFLGQDGESVTLKTLDTMRDELPAFGPIHDSAGLVLFGWQDRQSEAGYILGFSATGEQVYEANHDDLELGYQPPVAHDGSLLLIARSFSSNEQSFIQLIDATTGEGLARWSSPEDLDLERVLLADEHGVLALARGSSEQGPPPPYLVAFDARGDLEWQVGVSFSHMISLVERVEDGRARVLLTGGFETPGRLVLFGGDGEEVLWEEASSGSSITPYGRMPTEEGAILLHVTSGDGESSLVGLSLYGVVVWQSSLGSQTIDRLVVTPFGAIFTAVSRDGEDLPATMHLVGADGEIWSREVLGLGFESASLGLLGEHIVLAFYSEPDGVLTYEAVEPNTGHSIWQHESPDSPRSFSAWPMAWSEPWGLILAPLPLPAITTDFGEENRTALVGFIP